jgi:hypothetical protein
MTTYTDGFAITANNTTELVRSTNALYVGGAGTVAVVMANKNNTNTPLTFTAVAGQVIPIRVKIVKSTGTTATGLIGLL